MINVFFSGCQGGYPIEAWKYWVNQGVVTGANYGNSTI